MQVVLGKTGRDRALADGIGELDEVAGDAGLNQSVADVAAAADVHDPGHGLLRILV
jgi:hypothetical protein